MAAQQLQLVDNLALGQAGTGRLSDGGGSAQQCVDAYQVHQMFPSGPDPASGAGCRHDTATMPPSRSISPASNQVVFRLPAACQLQQQHSYSGASAALELSFTQPAAGLPPMPAPKQRAELVRVQGFTGVFWHTGRCAFRAYAPQHLPDGSKAKIKLGEFHTSDEAACAYDWFILTTQGPQGRTNYPASRYMTQQQPHQQYATGPCPAADLMARHPAAGMYSDYSHPTPSSSIDTQGMQVHHHRPGASSINQLQYSLGHAFDSCTSHKPSYCRQPPQQVQQHQQPLHMPEPGYQYGSHMQHSMPQHHMCRPLPSMYPAAPLGPPAGYHC